MKTKFLSIFAFVAILLVNSCKGPDGPIGPVGSTGTAGANGTNGTIGSTGTAGANGSNGKDGGTGATGATGSTGATGTNGKDGNANVVYSEWTTPDWGGEFYNYTESLQLSVKSTETPVFTKEALDKAAIYSYVKTQIIEYNTTDKEYKLVTDIQNLSSNGAYSYFKLAGKTTNQSADFGYLYFYGSNIRENYYKPYININKKQTYNSAKSAYDFTPELTNKTAADYRALAKDIPQIRHVVVYGSTKGRMASVNMKDYNEVKKAFNLKD